ncbi:MAG: class I SAM-dependent methyltransferase [Dehalococcoidia bacterium]|nr:class I SAM-dependent methyltransferase [Dehalococcoidia bacterium]
MSKANYGVYGSWAYYAVLAAIAVLSLGLVAFADFLRALLIITFVTSTTLLALLILVPQLLYARRRMGIVHEVIAAGKIGPNDRVLDVGTGRGFLAIEIAKAVKGCQIVGMDMWDMPAKGEMHKGFVLGDTRDNAERNARLEGMSNNVKFRQADAREMPFESESFDVVVSSFVMHQIVYGTGGPRVLQETYRVLKPRGRLVIVDLIIGKRITGQLTELGFGEIKVQKVKNLGPASLLLNMLSAVR